MINVAQRMVCSLLSVDVRICNYRYSIDNYVACLEAIHTMLFSTFLAGFFKYESYDFVWMNYSGMLFSFTH